MHLHACLAQLGPRAMACFCAILSSATFALAGPAAPPPDYDFQWAVVDHPGNAPYDGSLGAGNAGRGGVPYTYRISTLEVTSAQWLEFINIFAPQTSDPLFAFAPTHSGIQMTTLGHYALRVGVADPARLPVFGVTWRDAALFCNWLNNGKPTTLAAIQTGAYDTSTFTSNPDGTLNDQATHSPGAKFWIPTLDEWLKAAHYDPNRYGPGQEGWWKYSHTSDDPPVSGPPSQPGAQTSAAYDNVGSNPPSIFPLDIPLGAYPNARSPWGLFDTSGGAEEWTESYVADPSQRERVVDGSLAGSSSFFPQLDAAGFSSSRPPDFQGRMGFRLAGAVPSPTSLLSLVALGCPVLIRRSSRRHRNASASSPP